MDQQARQRELAQALAAAGNGGASQPSPEQAANGNGQLAPEEQNGDRPKRTYAFRAQTLGGRLDVDDVPHRLAGERDKAARERDELAARRDKDAALCDEAALEQDDRDRLLDRHTLRVEELRSRAAMGRRRAADDRLRAARDREQAARDREQAARDRELAARDREQAGIDELTGTRRRGVGLAEVQREIERAHRTHGRLVAAFVDVDDLKSVNDKQGHKAGDQLLRDVAGGLVSRMRSYDLVVRLGGDEFLCVLSDVTQSETRRRFDAFASQLNDCPAHRSVSFGVSQLRDGDSLEDLIDRADRDLIAGRNRQRLRTPRQGVKA
jgi:diguanylate cyclase (GGDEF)-like protein